MAHSIEYKTSAEKELDALDGQNHARILKAINGLKENPRPVGCKKLKGRDNEYRIQIGRYRVIYEIRDAVLIVLVVKVAHRGKVYR